MPGATPPPLTAVLLPGIDGTAKMFGPLQHALTDTLPCVPIAYPNREFLNYAALIDYVLARLPAGELVLIAESFSGPLALMLAEQLGHRARALVLVATFVSNPRPWLSPLAKWILRDWMFGIKPNKTLARVFVLGAAPAAMVDAVYQHHQQVAGHVSLGRLHEVFKVDVRKLFSQAQVPLLHLYAKRDRVVLQHSVREIQRLRPDITSVGIDGPHFLLQTRATECAAAIVNFLSQHQVL